MTVLERVKTRLTLSSGVTNVSAGMNHTLILMEQSSAPFQ